MPKTCPTRNVSVYGRVEAIAYEWLPSFQSGNSLLHLMNLSWISFSRLDYFDNVRNEKLTTLTVSISYLDPVFQVNQRPYTTLYQFDEKFRL